MYIKYLDGSTLDHRLASLCIRPDGLNLPTENERVTISWWPRYPPLRATRHTKTQRGKRSVSMPRRKTRRKFTRNPGGVFARNEPVEESVHDDHDRADYFGTFREIWGIFSRKCCNYKKRNLHGYRRIATPRSRSLLLHIPNFFFSEVMTQNVSAKIVLNGPYLCMSSCVPRIWFEVWTRFDCVG